MNHLGTSSVRRRGAKSVIYNFAALVLIVLLNFALVASALKEKSGTVIYIYTVSLVTPPPCPEEQVAINILVFGTVQNKDGTIIDKWPVPAVEIVLSEPKLGKFTKKEFLGPGLNGPTSMQTNALGNAYAIYEAKETGEESIQIQFIGYDFRTDHNVSLTTSRSFRVRNCLVAPIFNLFATANLPTGSLTIWGVGGGEARINDDGQISGDGELSLTETVPMPEKCTPVESSGTASFTISGNRNKENINLKFDFGNLTIPPESSTCTAGGVSIPVQVLPGNSGDPAVATGFHELSVPAGGGTTYFPYPVAEYSGGTTVVVTLIREESTASEFNPFTAIGALPIWSWR